MQRIRTFLATASALSVVWATALPVAITHAVAPAMASPTGLSILEIKMTGDEFVLLQNNTGAAISDLNSYWLMDFNNVNPLSAGVSSSQQQLPSATLGTGQTLLLSAAPMPTCGASVAGKLSMSLGDSSGFLQLVKLGATSSGALGQTAGDFVNWSSVLSGSIQSVPSNTKNPQAAYYRYFDGTSYPWQLASLDATNGCQLNFVVAGDPGSSSAVTPLTLAATSPPATIVGTAASADGAATLPAADVGLTAPQISELLPNPTGTGNDATDEFIELYNPNAKPFDLSGFTLQTGLTTARNFVFPTGTTLAASSFHAFYAPETKLTLSNTSSQVALLDPLGNVLATTDAYSSAKDGLAWALANGKWQWTMRPTPNAANVIQQPAATAKKAITKKIAAKVIGGNSAAGTGGSASGTGAAAASIVHSWVLALVAALALLYGAYEYRRDLGNRLLQLKTKLGARRTNRQTLDGRRSD